MKKLSEIIIALVVAVFIIVAVLPTVGYVMLSTDWAQEKLRSTSQEVLERLLGVDVKVGEVQFQPFNRIKVLDVKVDDDYGQHACGIGMVDARFELLEFLLKRKLAVDYVVIDELDGHIYKLTPESPLNINEIIKRLASDKKDKKESVFDLRLDDIEILNSRLSYDVKSVAADSGHFCKDHITLDDLNIVLHAPVVSNDTWGVRLKRMSFVEGSGFEVKNLSAIVSISPTQAMLTDLVLRLQNSRFVISELSASIDGIQSIPHIGTSYPVTLKVKEGSTLYPPDFKAFFPNLEKIDDELMIDLYADGTIDSLTLHKLNVSDGIRGLSLNASGSVLELPDIERAKWNDLQVDIEIGANRLVSNIELLRRYLDPKALRILSRLGNAHISAKADGRLENSAVRLSLTSSDGKIGLQGNAGLKNDRLRFDVSTGIDALAIGRIFDVAELGRISGSAKAKGSLYRGKLEGDLNLKVSEFEYKDYEYHDIIIAASLDKAVDSLSVYSLDPNASISLNVRHEKDNLHGLSTIDAHGFIANLRLDSLNLSTAYPEHSISMIFDMDAQVESLRRFKGELDITGFKWVDDNGAGLEIENLGIDVNNLDEGMNQILISSEIVNGEVQGKYEITDMWSDVKDLICDVFPVFSAYIKQDEPKSYDGVNDFTFEFRVEDAKDVSDFFHLPISLTDPFTITGEFSQTRHIFLLEVDLPWLLQNNNVIDGTNVQLLLDGNSRIVDVYATSHIPTKKGPMSLVASVKGENGDINTKVDWQIERDVPINGNFEFLTTFRPAYPEGLETVVVFEPGQINFGNDEWNILRSDITLQNRHVKVNNFAMKSGSQSIMINGEVGDSPDDKAVVNLENIKLVDIFETLSIDNALICGLATGEIVASNVFSETPDIRSTHFKVKDIGYNYCVLGDGDLKLSFDVEEQKFRFYADIINQENLPSTINGYIKPATEELELEFDANHIKVGFMHHFMKAFCSKIEGYASGKARLYGTFKYIDMEGDIYADSLKMGIEFTGTEYMASDSIHIDPGLINLQDITIYDRNGNTALVNGYVKHNFFMEPSFDVKITDARDFLCYDVNEKEDQPWAGQIYGDGYATVVGAPGYVNIGANMTTQQHTEFTYILSDLEVAEEYSFITFRDVTPKSVIVDSIMEVIVEPKAKKIKRENNGDESQISNTAYNLDLTVDINKDAKITLVMDPIARDKIVCSGVGHMRMTYGSVNNDISLMGEYTLDQGAYSFSIQNLIFRDFKIDPGSKITFSGDPYEGVLDITARYSTMANITDLDESFANDKDLNNTRVQVAAVMKVSGNMRQPDIDFDIDLPTVSQETNRKVHSIVSTEEMMNTQIIYLLALNRFYTPDYMSATKGDVLFSVASSTISNQLSSILGKLSDNWSIAPNLRSDRGDFSDLEVDVSLQSNLLNNRLFINGNLGYRDKSLNSNQFIGDFDLEYLLNRQGTFRFKGYSRTNDQNYYLRTAKTTQGLGFLIKHDFDNIFRRKELPKVEEILVDTLRVTEPVDSIIDAEYLDSILIKN